MTTQAMAVIAGVLGGIPLGVLLTRELDAQLRRRAIARFKAALDTRFNELLLGRPDLAAQQRERPETFWHSIGFYTQPDPERKE